MATDIPDPQDPSPSQEVVRSDAAVDVAAGTGFSANFDVSVIYKGDTYTLLVVPKGADDTYGVQLTQTPVTPLNSPTNTIAEFAIKDEKDWKVALDVPVGANGLALGGITIKNLTINFGAGTVTFPTTNPI